MKKIATYFSNNSGMTLSDLNDKVNAIREQMRNLESNNGLLSNVPLVNQTTAMGSDKVSTNFEKITASKETFMQISLLHRELTLINYVINVITGNKNKFQKRIEELREKKYHNFIMPPIMPILGTVSTYKAMEKKKGSALSSTEIEMSIVDEELRMIVESHVLIGVALEAETAKLGFYLTNSSRNPGVLQKLAYVEPQIGLKESYGKGVILQEAVYDLNDRKQYQKDYENVRKYKNEIQVKINAIRSGIYTLIDDRTEELAEEYSGEMEKYEISLREYNAKASEEQAAFYKDIAEQITEVSKLRKEWATKKFMINKFVTENL